MEQIFFLQHSNAMIIRLKKPVAILVSLVCLASVHNRANCQPGNNSYSPIWGANSNYSLTPIGEPLYNQRAWGIAPSQETMNSIVEETGIQRNSRPNTRQRITNQAGDVLLTDSQGNFVYDNSGNQIIDSTLNSDGSMSGSINADADGPILPPDDPVDVPIDGGVEILLMIGLGVGYQNRKKVQLVSAKISL